MTHIPPYRAGCWSSITSMFSPLGCNVENTYYIILQQTCPVFPDELEGQLADVQEASETAAIRLAEAEKEVARLRQDKALTSSVPASALQRENSRLREMVSGKFTVSHHAKPVRSDIC